MLAATYHIVLPDGSWFRFQIFDLLELVVLPLALIVLRWKGRGVGYLICFALFFTYLRTALYHTLCPFPSGYVEPSVAEMIDIYWNRAYWLEAANLVPGDFLKTIRSDPYQTYGNFMMGVPFGFGLPFVTARPPRRMLALCFAFGLGLELNELAVGLIVFRLNYRSIDVDDVLLVFVGAACGYGVLRVVAALYRWLGWSFGARVPVWRHFHRVLVEAFGGAARGAGAAAGSGAGAEAGSRS